MILSENNLETLDSYLESFGIATTRQQRELLLQHLDLVVEKNKVMNLTRIVDDREAIIRHLVDSLLLVPSIEGAAAGQEISFVDVGTGAGFPGIPLGIVRKWNGTLIDSVGKKVRAVSEFIASLGLEDRLTAESVRAEDLARHQSERFDIVTARAVADLGVLVEYASPLLKAGGALVVSKAQIASDEIARGDKTGKIVGLQRVSRETYELPEDQGHREILTYKKTTKSKVKLPRQTGMAKNKPLV